MLSAKQLEALTEEQLLEYQSLVDSNDKDGLAQFEYFFGFTLGDTEVKIPTNHEIEVYKQMTDQIKLKHIAKMLGFVPHIGQQPIFYTIDEQADLINNIVMVLGRRAQTLDSVIKTPSGDITFRDIKVGTEVFDPDGGTQSVIGVHDIYEGDVYEVTIGDRKVKVDAQHLFTVVDSLGNTHVLDVEYLLTVPNLHEYRIRNVQPLAYPTKAFDELPYSVGVNIANSKVSPSYYADYLSGSISQRVELLLGMSSVLLDGIVTKTPDTLLYYIPNKDVATYLRELVHSLGGCLHWDAIVKQCYVQLPFNPFNDELASIYKPTELTMAIRNIKPLGKQPVRCISVSSATQCYITDDYVRTHNTGKSVSTSVIACRELAVPYSSTILLTPTFNNAKIIFNEVLKNIQKLKLPIKAINRGAFRFELENGARFSANSASNIESALGSYNSLIIVDESQSVPNLTEIMNQMLVPTLLDYGMRPSGVLYGRQIYLGTPRGQENQLYDLFCKQDDFPNWKSFNSPSTCNPILPTSYFEQMRLELGEMLYRQEILAEFFGSDDNVLWAFNKELNTYKDGDIKFNHHMAVVSGLDIGLRDSTAQLWAYRDSSGNYYIDEAYQKNMTSTSTHISNYREIEGNMLREPEMRYGDPAAAQTLFDYNQDYGYLVHPANNSFLDSINYLNQMFSPSGANNRPRLFINAKLTELIRQISRVRWKDKVSKSSKDPFVTDAKGTHWDLIAALRYMMYSDSFNLASGFIIESRR